MKLTSTIMRAAAATVREHAQGSMHANRAYFVCFAVEDAANGDTSIRPELEALLVRDGKSLCGNWHKELEYGASCFVRTEDIPGFAPRGPERQELRAKWCDEIADELEEQELMALALQTR